MNKLPIQLIFFFMVQKVSLFLLCNRKQEQLLRQYNRVYNSIMMKSFQFSQESLKLYETHKNFDTFSSTTINFMGTTRLQTDGKV